MNDKCRSFFGILCLPLLCAAPLFGDGASAWKQIGPDGGDVRALARNPKTPSELYALAGYSWNRVYRSTNGGVSWIQTAALPDEAYNLVTDAVTPGVVYVLCSSGIYKSTNRGAAFKSFRFPGNGAGYAGGGDLAANPVKSGIIHAAGRWIDSKSKSYVAVQTSVDGGRTWTLRQLEGPVHLARCVTIAISPKAPETLYVTAIFCAGAAYKDYNRVYKSVDGGATWKKLAFPALADYDLIYDLAVDPKSDKRVFVATSDGVLYTTNGGTTWKKPASQTACGVSSIAVDPVRSRVVYAQSEDYLDSAAFFRSEDGGATWTSAGSGVYGHGRCFLTGYGRLYLGSCAGVFLSLDGGLSFKPAHKGIKAARISALGLAPPSAGMIYVQATNGYAWFATANGGSTWRMGTAFPGSGAIQTIKVSATDVNQAYLLADCPDESGEAFIYKTVDGGRSVKSLLRGRVVGIDLAAADPLRLYAVGQIQNDAGSGPRYFGIFRTLDGGNTWTQVKVREDSDSRGTAVAVAPSNPDTIYAGGVSGYPYNDVVYKSIDGGAVWSRLAGDFDCPPEIIIVDPVSPGTVYLGTGFSVYRSVDGGASWTRLSGVQLPYAVAVNRLDPNEVFVGTRNGLFYSKDKGTTWTNLTAGLPVAWVSCVEIDPVARQVYVGTVGGGVLRRGF